MRFINGLRSALFEQRNFTSVLHSFDINLSFKSNKSLSRVYLQKEIKNNNNKDYESKQVYAAQNLKIPP